MSFSADDHRFMAQALRLAERGLFTTTPNPRVGCVLVRDGKVLGEGWHEKAGGPHAEAHALESAAKIGAGDTASPAKGCIAYVTLEPCAHHGRTPPCADALIGAGIARVVAAMRDPNPLVAGRGLSKLAEAGIAVETGLLEDEARELNIGFVSRMTRGRPWLRLKAAISLDGKTALENGLSQWITGPAARRDGHAWRARSCAVLTGIGTLKDDDPQLTVRAIETPRQPQPILIDSRLEAPLTAKLFDRPTLVFAAVADSPKLQALAARGHEVILLPDTTGKVDLTAMLAELGRRGHNEILVEGGNKLNASLLREGLVDELLIYQAPILIGDSARGLAALPALETLGAARRLRIVERRAFGEDWLLRARFA